MVYSYLLFSFFFFFPRGLIIPMSSIPSSFLVLPSLRKLFSLTTKLQQFSSSLNHFVFAPDRSFLSRSDFCISPNSANSPDTFLFWLVSFFNFISLFPLLQNHEQGLPQSAKRDEDRVWRRMNIFALQENEYLYYTWDV